MVSRVGGDGGARSPETDLLREIRNEIGNATIHSDKNFHEVIAELRKLQRLGGVGGGGGGGKDSGPYIDPNAKGSDGDTVLGLLEKIKEALIVIRSELTRSAVADDGTGGGGGGHSSGFAEFEKAKASISVFEERIVELNQFAFIPLKSSAIQLRANIDGIKDKLIQFGQNLVSTHKITDYFSESWEHASKAARTGTDNIIKVLMSDVRRVLSFSSASSDSLFKTYELINKRLEDGFVSPLLLTGRSAEEFSKVLVSGREEIRKGGFAFYERMGFQEMNDTMLALYESQRRRNIQEDMSSISSSRAMRQQLKYFDLIAQNTGRTVDELVKQSSDVRLSFDELKASGVLTEQQTQNYMKAYDYLTNIGQSGLADIVKAVAESGDSLENYLAKNPEMTTSLAATGTLGLIKDIIGTTRRADSLSDVELSRVLTELIKSNRNLSYQGVVAAETTSPEFRKMAAQLGTVTKEFQRIKDSNDEGIMSWVNYFGDIFTNTLPKNMLAMLTSVGANTIALGVNTAALFTHAGFLTGKKGILGKLAELVVWGKILPGAGGAGGAAAAAGGGAAAAGGAAAGGGMLARMLPGMLKMGKIAGIGLAAATGVGAVGLGLTALVSFLPEIIDGTKALFGASGVSGGQSDPANISRTNANSDIVYFMRQQTELLIKIESLMRESTEYQRDIRYNTNRIGIGNDSGFFSGWFSSESKRWG